MEDVWGPLEMGVGREEVAHSRGSVTKLSMQLGDWMRRGEKKDKDLQSAYFPDLGEVTWVLRKACWCWWLGQWEEFG